MSFQEIKLWWPIQSKGNFLITISAAWAILAFAIVAALQLKYSGSIHFVESMFAIVGGGLTGLLWSLTMWSIFVKPRLDRIVKHNAGANTPDEI